MRVILKAITTSQQWNTLRLDASHYAGRVTSLVQSEYEAYSTDERRKVLSYVALLFLNKLPSSQLRELMPDSFRWVGLFDMSTEPITPVCPAVTIGIYKAMMDASGATLQSILEHQVSHWNGLLSDTSGNRCLFTYL